jgi:hypothetical protein
VIYDILQKGQLNRIAQMRFACTDTNQADGTRDARAAQIAESFGTFENLSLASLVQSPTRRLRDQGTFAVDVESRLRSVDPATYDESYLEALDSFSKATVLRTLKGQCFACTA